MPTHPKMTAGPSRRQMLHGAAAGGLVAAAGVGIAACSSDNSEPEDEAGANGAGQSPEPETPAGEPTNGDQGGGEQGQALIATAEVPVAGGMVLEAEKIVVTQPSEGEFKAFSAVCTHRGCTVDSVSDGVIACPCHGSRFNAADGSVAGGPASRPLPEVAVAVQGENVVRA